MPPIPPMPAMLLGGMEPIRFMGFCKGLPMAAAKGAVTAVTEAGKG
jgi:hypothetical protein